MDHGAQVTTWSDIRRAKLHLPTMGAGLISRPRVIAALEQSIAAPVTLVVGPAGSGKTTALSEWSTCTSFRRVAWLSLDQMDSDLDRFVAHLIASIRRVIPEFGGQLQRNVGISARDPNLLGESIAEALFDLDDQLVLTLDDLHDVINPEVFELISAIVRYPPPMLHLVITARWDPPLPVSRLRGRGLLNEIRAADLRFNEEETERLLQASLNYTPDSTVTAMLHQRTEGWAAGLRLACMALQEEDSDSPLRIDASGDRNVMDFLVEEVLRSQSPEVQRFLLRTSITDRTCPALAAAIMGGELTEAECSVMLDTLTRSNLYVEHVESARTWYRYHRLFRDLLRHRTTLELNPAEIETCHLRASAWLSEHGFVTDAIRHALMTGDEACAGELAEAYRYDAFNRDDWAAIKDWLDILPDSVVAERPALLLTQLSLAYLRGKRSAVRAMLGEVGTLLDRGAASNDTGVTKMLRAEGNLIHALTLDPESDVNEIEALLDLAIPDLPPVHCHARGTAYYLAGLTHYGRDGAEAALAYLQDCLFDDLSPGEIVLTDVLLAQAHIHWVAGNLHECERIAHYALQIATTRQLTLATSWARLLIGKVRYELNDLPEAEQNFGTVVSNHRIGHFLYTTEALIGLALTRQALGNESGANAASSRLLELILELESFELLPISEALQVRLALLQGRDEPALQWLGGKGSGSAEDTRFVQVTHLLARKAHSSPFSDETIRALASSLAAGTGRLTNRRDQTVIDALFGLSRLESGESLISMTELLTRLRESMRLGYLRCLIDLRPVIGPFLRAARAGGEGWAERLLDWESDPEPLPVTSSTLNRGSISHGAHRTHVLEVLTEREVEVLSCLSEHLSNQEIAERLFISPLTVKRHASNIYDKLAVNSRRQALVKATQLGFLPAH